MSVLSSGSWQNFKILRELLSSLHAVKAVHLEFSSDANVNDFR